MLLAAIEEEGDSPDHSDDDDFQQLLSDETPIAGTTWKLLKPEAMAPDYHQKDWFQKLDTEGKKLLSALKAE